MRLLFREIFAIYIIADPEEHRPPESGKRAAPAHVPMLLNLGL
jgi:hypothetical protein